MAITVASALVVVAIFCSHVAMASYEKREHRPQGWLSWGGDLDNTRSSRGHDSRAISPRNIASLAKLHYVNASASVPAGPTTTGDALMYFTDVKGTLMCADRTSGAIKWAYDIAAFLKSRGVRGTPTNPLGSRSAPAIHRSAVYIGTLAGGYVLKVQRFSGKLLWYKQVDEHPFAALTQSVRVYDGTVFVGVSSLEEVATVGLATYKTTFIGSFQALDADTGAVKWSRKMLPAGYAGGAVWGSEPPVDVARKQIVIATGNPYRVPAAVEKCRTATKGKAATFPDPCRRPGDLSESVVALDLRTGAIKWAFSQSPVEVWTLACGVNLPDIAPPLLRNPAACPQTPGPDIDFGTAPILVHACENATPARRDVVLAGQKSGVVWALDAATGKLLWSSVTGFGGAYGGIMFGSATDGKSYFYAQSNSGGKPYKLKSGAKTTLGHVGSLSVLTGEIQWQAPLQCRLTSPVSYANGLVYAPCGQNLRSAKGGQLHVFDALDGKEVYKFLGTAGTIAGGVTVVGDKAYVPAGITTFEGAPDTAQGGVYIFGLQRKHA